MIIVYILGGILLLGILIFVHELGHFVAGLITGVPVETFSIGYGKGIISKTIRGVKFQIGMFPIGGFCKFKGEDPTNEEEDPNGFYNVSPWKRIVIAVMGPLFNYLFAVLILIILAMGYTSYEYDSTRLEVYPNYRYLNMEAGETVAHKAGLRSGDTLVRVNDTKIETLKDYEDFIMKNKALLSKKEGLGFDISVTTLRLEEVLTNSPAARAGLKKGDVIRSVNGTPVNYFSEFRTIVYDNPDKNVSITYERDGTLYSNVVTPMTVTETIEGTDRAYGRVGVQFAQNTNLITEVPKKSFFPAVGFGFVKSVDLIRDYIGDLVSLFSGRLAKGGAYRFTVKRAGEMKTFTITTEGIPLKDSVGGPVGITAMGANIVSRGLRSALGFLAMISLILFVMNLLPIPVVDGSIIVFSLWELIAQRKLDRKLITQIQMVGVAILLTLGVFITINDITRLFK